jgi:hypothetical protein
MELCKLCKGNKVVYPLGGIEVKCMNCNGIGHIVPDHVIYAKSDPVKALQSKLESARKQAQ